jgi:MYXO-CTERM domain-containing protein
VGFECDYCGTVRLTNVAALGNSSRGLILHGSGALTVVNSTIDGGGKGNGIDIWPSTGSVPTTSTVKVVNTILSNNRIAIELDLRNAPATLTTTHSTFWGSQITNLRTLSTDPDASRVDLPESEVPPGAANAVADPKYVSATDLHLSAGSPCIDSGAADGAPDHDLDQGVRPLDGDGSEDTDASAFDRGAYEFRIDGGMSGEGGTSGNDGGAAGNDSGAAGDDDGTAAHDSGGAGHGGRADTGGGGGSATPGSTGGALASGGTAGAAIAGGGRVVGAVSGAGGDADTGGNRGSVPTPAAGGDPPAGDRGGCGCVLTPGSDGAWGPISVLALIGLRRRYRKRSARAD